jgi:CHAP domain-containing protein
VSRPALDSGKRRGVEVRRYRQPRPFRRLVLIGATAAVAVGVVASHGLGGKSRSFPLPSKASLATLSMPRRIAAIATSQVGYTTDPADSYCNKFSGFWAAGDACSNGETGEEWCADFAAWAWRKAGVQFAYGYDPGEINGAAISFYDWAVANGRWQPATGAYVAAPGDVAVYGLSLAAAPHAAHVAVVIRDQPGRRGPDVVNGDGNLTAFSAVETGEDQRYITVGNKRYALAGYARPPTR